MNDRILIGRKGRQPFAITAEGVSAEHAMLTRQPDGTLVLEDLGSKNGTYIFDETDRSFHRIVRKVVMPETIVRLGADSTIRSCRFTVRRLLKEDPDDYSEEFQEILDRWEALTALKTKAEHRANVATFIPLIVSLILVVATFFLPDSMPANHRINLMRGAMMLPALLAPVVGLASRRRLKSINQELKELMVCPNPDCGMPLSEANVRRGLCTYCKKHI